MGLGWVGYGLGPRRPSQTMHMTTGLNEAAAAQCLRIPSAVHATTTKPVTTARKAPPPGRPLPRPSAQPLPLHSPEAHFFDHLLVLHPPVRPLHREHLPHEDAKGVHVHAAADLWTRVQGEGAHQASVHRHKHACMEKQSCMCTHLLRMRDHTERNAASTAGYAPVRA
eukprot:360870-Chlamydomonas_euryale.AAC.17